MQLESLSSNLFAPLSQSDAREVLGGVVAPVYKYTGPCGVKIGGQLVVIDDYE
jgi:hypothetical protein